jgi:hypothetical protein
MIAVMIMRRIVLHKQDHLSSSPSDVGWIPTILHIRELETVKYSSLEKEVLTLFGKHVVKDWAHPPRQLSSHSSNPVPHLVEQKVEHNVSINNCQC